MIPEPGRLRLVVYQVAIAVAFVAIALTLWDLQIVSADKYQQSADQNQYRLLSITAPRGVLYDRMGKQLVLNVPSFTVSIVPAGLPEDMDERRAVLERVAADALPARTTVMTGLPFEGMLVEIDVLAVLTQN